MQDIIERLEKATGPDRELDRELGFAFCGWRVVDIAGNQCIDQGDGEINADHPGGMYTSFTESIDAAMTLVVEGFRWVIESKEWSELRETYLVPVAYVESELPDRSKSFRAEGATPAIALCIAALKARQA